MMKQGTQADVNRRLENVLRFGVVKEVDTKKACARVQIGSDVFTDFLPWLTYRAGASQTWSAPDVGEKVLVLSPSGNLENAVILPGFYNENAPSDVASKHVFFNSKTGFRMEFDDESEDLSTTQARNVLIQAVDSIVFKVGDVSLTLGSGGLSVVGTVLVSGDVVADGISLVHHSHISNGLGNYVDSPS